MWQSSFFGDSFRGTWSQVASELLLQELVGNRGITASIAGPFLSRLPKVVLYRMFFPFCFPTIFVFLFCARSTAFMFFIALPFSFGSSFLGIFRCHTS